ncbi:hypothetical protein AB0J38_14855 [Streptomyces sp. NPDC050095]|uniref:hypothetical protein n=1 Tax=unclassified Streptomyces TaxID=2593676 RepID=UPI00344974ED
MGSVEPAFVERLLGRLLPEAAGSGEADVSSDAVSYLLVGLTTPFLMFVGAIYRTSSESRREKSARVPDLLSADRELNAQISDSLDGLCEIQEQLDLVARGSLPAVWEPLVRQIAHQLPPWIQYSPDVELRKLPGDLRQRIMQVDVGVIELLRNHRQDVPESVRAAAAGASRVSAALTRHYEDEMGRAQGDPLGRVPISAWQDGQIRRRRPHRRVPISGSGSQLSQ